MKLALITGATKGIGRSTAITFANSGWDLVLLSRNLEAMEILKEELSNTPSRINLLTCDLTNSIEIENSIKELINKKFIVKRKQKEGRSYWLSLSEKFFQTFAVSNDYLSQIGSNKK